MAKLQDLEIADGALAPGDAAAGRDDELNRYRKLLALATLTCERAANGDLEARVLHCEGSDESQRLADAVNHLLDMTDAFLREVGASLDYASRGKFFRRVLLRGMRGSFERVSEMINLANDAMERDAALKESVEHRRVLADQFEETVKKVFSGLASSANRVNVASATLSEAAGVGTAASSAANSAKNPGTTAGAITSFRDGARHGNGRRLNEVIGLLTDASQRIGGVVKLISQIAGKTNLLALNATIEAARAGDAGRGFAVVASEVKSLADQTRNATEQIGNEIAQMRATVDQTAELVGTMSNSIGEMNSISTELSRQSDELSGAVDSFLQTIRA